MYQRVFADFPVPNDVDKELQVRASENLNSTQLGQVSCSLWLAISILHCLFQNRDAAVARNPKQHVFISTIEAIKYCGQNAWSYAWFFATHHQLGDHVIFVLRTKTQDCRRQHYVIFLFYLWRCRTYVGIQTQCWRTEIGQILCIAEMTLPCGSAEVQTKSFCVSTT